MERKYLPTLADLLDRLSILQLKEIFISEHKAEYAAEIKDVEHDIDLLIKDCKFSAELLRAIIVLAQFNTHIWYNESAVRAGTVGDDKLRLTHSINGVRNLAKNIISATTGERKDYKIDCLAENFKDWMPSI